MINFIFRSNTSIKNNRSSQQTHSNNISHTGEISANSQDMIVRYSHRSHLSVPTMWPDGSEYNRLHEKKYLSAADRCKSINNIESWPNLRELSLDRSEGKICLIDGLRIRSFWSKCVCPALDITGGQSLCYTDDGRSQGDCTIRLYDH